MNLDLTIQRMAYAEGRTFAAVQALIAKRRGDVLIAAVNNYLDKPETPPPGFPHVIRRIDKHA
jgi:hypothetical protein